MWLFFLRGPEKSNTMVKLIREEVFVHACLLVCDVIRLATVLYRVDELIDSAVPDTNGSKLEAMSYDSPSYKVMK